MLRMYSSGSVNSSSVGLRRGASRMAEEGGSGGSGSGTQMSQRGPPVVRGRGGSFLCARPHLQGWFRSFSSLISLSFFLRSAWASIFAKSFSVWATTRSSRRGCSLPASAPLEVFAVKAEPAEGSVRILFDGGVRFFVSALEIGRPALLLDAPLSLAPLPLFDFVGGSASSAASSSPSASSSSSSASIFTRSRLLVEAHPLGFSTAMSPGRTRSTASTRSSASRCLFDRVLVRNNSSSASPRCVRAASLCSFAAATSSIAGWKGLCSSWMAHTDDIVC
mmetsp:Transcript_34195/g.73028  ORF Transcript_34195/g.73028 Transcript_34195/m.73028 type:complete len:278 (-) Transcript_34195:103-936(-)